MHSEIIIAKRAMAVISALSLDLLLVVIKSSTREEHSANPDSWCLQPPPTAKAASIRATPVTQAWPYFNQ